MAGKQIDCNECDGTGTFTKGIEPTDCPWCHATGKVEESYAVYGGGHNGDFAWREIYDVKETLDAAMAYAKTTFGKRFDNVLENGTPTMTYMEIVGPNDTRSVEADAAGALVWMAA